MTDYKNILNFLFEVGHANEVMNVGWSLIKVNDPPSMAEHSYRNAIIALIIAKLEKLENPYRCAFAALIHKLHKTRLGDRHKVSANYLDYPPEVKLSISKDQLSLLGEDLKEEFQNIQDLTQEEKVIVKDADQLELALQAKEYLDKGYERASIWLERIEKVLQTDAAREIFKNIKNTHSCDWWKDLKKKPQTDLDEYVSRV